MESHIFIGGHKCGSTSLQIFFATKFKQLKTQGFIYPYSDIDSIILSRKASERGNISNLQKTINRYMTNKDFMEPHNGLAFQMLAKYSNSPCPPWHKKISSNPEDIFKLIQLQIEDVKPKKIIIVSEVMSNFAFTNRNLIDDLLRSIGPSKHSIYAVLRRPDEYLQSWYGQELIFPGKMLPPIRERYENTYKNSCHFNYQRMIEPWASSKNIENLQLFNYSNINDITTWFTKEIDFSYPRLEKVKPKQRSNLSLHKSYYGFVNYCKNRYKQNAIGKIIYNIKNFSTVNILPKNSTVDILGSELRKKIYNDFAFIHKYISRISSAELFFPDYEEIIEGNYVDYLSIEDDSLNELSSYLRTQEDGLFIIDAINDYNNAKN